VVLTNPMLDSTCTAYKECLIMLKLLEQSNQECGQWSMWHARQRWDMHKGFWAKNLTIRVHLGDLGIDRKVICKWILQQYAKVWGWNSSVVNRRIYCEHDNELLVSIHSGGHLVSMVMILQVPFTVGTPCEHGKDPSGSIQSGKHLVNIVISLQFPFAMGTSCEHVNDPSSYIRSGRILWIWLRFFRFHSEWGKSCEHRNKPSGSIRNGNILWIW
jgi:hypothetical protein